jgi:hypothetical protein
MTGEAVIAQFEDGGKRGVSSITPPMFIRP